MAGTVTHGPASIVYIRCETYFDHGDDVEALAEQWAEVAGRSGREKYPNVSGRRVAGNPARHLVGGPDAQLVASAATVTASSPRCLCAPSIPRCCRLLLVHTSSSRAAP